MAAESNNDTAAYETAGRVDGGRREPSEWEQAFRKEIGLRLEIWSGDLQTDWLAIGAAVEGGGDVPGATAAYCETVTEAVHGPVDSYLRADPTVSDEQADLFYQAVNVLDYAGTVAANLDENGEYHGKETTLGGFASAVEHLADIAQQLEAKHVGGEDDD